jgi:hypothetical protein
MRLDSSLKRDCATSRRAYQNFEPFHEFVVPARVCGYSSGSKALAFDPISLLGEVGEDLVAGAYGFSAGQTEEVEKDFEEAIAYQRRGQTSNDDEEAEEADFLLDTSPRASEERLFCHTLLAAPLGGGTFVTPLANYNPRD